MYRKFLRSGLFRIIRGCAPAWSAYASVALSMILSYAVFRGAYHMLFPLFWLVLIVAYLLSFRPDTRLSGFFGPKINIYSLLTLLICILLPVIVRLLFYQSGRMHGDDAITGYFSAIYDLRHTDFFGPVPENRGAWVSQFPSLYFILQKIFFKITGVNGLTLKLSVLPYVAIVGVMTYATARNYTGRFYSLLAVYFSSFLAISIYLETLGLHFISSTAVFMIFFYTLLRANASGEMFKFALGGVACGLCYLFYSSSYIAFPVGILLILAGLSVRKAWTGAGRLLVFLAGFSVVLLPFAGYMARTGSFYLNQRARQVSFLTGSWSPVREQLNQGIQLTKILADQTKLSLESLYRSGVGGHGGYDFGHNALFDRFTLILLAVSFFTVLIMAVKKPGLISLLMLPLITFISGVILTISPPAFHRFSLAFPYLAVIMALAVSAIGRLTGRIKTLSTILTGIILIVFGITNLRHLLLPLEKESVNESLYLSNFINAKYPGRRLHVASFPGYSFDSTYYFSEGRSATSVDVDYHGNYLNSFKRNEKYVYVMIYPTEFIPKFISIDPKGRIVYMTNSYAVFVN